MVVPGPSKDSVKSKQERLWILVSMHMNRKTGNTIDSRSYGFAIAGSLYGRLLLVLRDVRSRWLDARWLRRRWHWKRLAFTNLPWFRLWRKYHGLGFSVLIGNLGCSCNFPSNSRKGSLNVIHSIRDLLFRFPFQPSLVRFRVWWSRGFQSCNPW